MPTAVNACLEVEIARNFGLGWRSMKARIAVVKKAFHKDVIEQYLPGL